MASGPSRGLLAACAIIVNISCNAAQVSLPFQCSFESDDLCGMTQRTDDHFNWTRHTGPTPSDATGPNSALDGDYYIYIEASYHEDGDRAIIETPPLRFSGVICVQFWYHMYTLNPPHMGRLVVFTESQGEGNPLFNVGGEDKGDQWIPEQITVTGFMNDDKIVFLNEERNNHQGDMALDMIDIQGGTCNACALNNGGCDTRCVPDGKGTRCECDVGYHLDGDGVTCIEDNECAANGGRGDCSHTCYNTPGSYTCSCPTGYELGANDRTCRDIDECVPNGGKGDCSHQCDNTPSSYRCDCYSGYTLNGDQKSCADINECIVNGGKGPCDVTCDNNPGSYRCSCPGGQYLQNDGTTCADIDECAANGGKGDCDQQCDNTPGSYQCRCYSGYTLNGDQKSCDDINECIVNGGKGPCDVTCDNNPGSYRCSCPGGQYLQNDGTTCADVTSPPTTTTTSTTTTPPPIECLADHECDQLCHNTHEGYFCSCRDSFLLADDKRHCIDCQDVYRKQLDASQAFTSLCPTIETYLNVPLTTCLIHACADNATVVSYRNSVCSVKLCVGSNRQLDPTAGSSGWDIYVLNTTWTGPRSEDASSFPLWQLLTGVFVGAAALGAIIAVVTVYIRKRISSGEGEGRAPYENAETITRHETTAENAGTQPDRGVYEDVLISNVQTTRGPNDVTRHEITAENTATQSEGGVDDEVFTPDVEKTRGPNDVMV